MFRLGIFHVQSHKWEKRHGSHRGDNHVKKRRKSKQVLRLTREGGTGKEGGRRTGGGRRLTIHSGPSRGAGFKNLVFYRGKRSARGRAVAQSKKDCQGVKRHATGRGETHTHPPAKREERGGKKRSNKAIKRDYGPL